MCVHPYVSVWIKAFQKQFEILGIFTIALHFKLLTFFWKKLATMFQHLCFKQAQSKMCHSSKIDDGVNILKKILNTYFWTCFFRTLNCHHTKTVRAFDLIPMLRTWPEYQLSADIHSHKAGTKLPHKLALYCVWP